MAVTETLLLLPGLMCDSAVWAHQRTHLSRHARIIIPEFRGFDSLTAMAQHVLDTAPEAYAVAGHSMGGRVALELFNLAPERMKRLALLDTGVHPKNPGEDQVRQEYIDLALQGGMEAVAEKWIPPMIHPERLGDTDLTGAIKAMVERTSVAEFTGQIRALLNRPDASACLPRIKCPTLLLAGRQDSWSPPGQHEAMLQQIPNATLVIIENSGHMTPMERPEAVTAALQDWLNMERGYRI